MPRLSSYLVTLQKEGHEAQTFWVMSLDEKKAITKARRMCGGHAAVLEIRSTVKKSAIATVKSLEGSKWKESTVLSHHAPECAHRDEPPAANERNNYIDAFCTCNNFEEPRILDDKTSIAWPAGWTQQQADAWRQDHSLPRPTTWLERIDGGKVQLVTQDQEMKQRAAAAEEDPQVFVFWNGERQDALAGVVTDSCQDGDSLRFTVQPTEEGAHAI